MFVTEKLSNGLELHINSTDKFRTNIIQVFVERPLDEAYTKFALLPNVLKRGTASYPLTIDLAKRWDSLYGASFNVQVYKLGDRHAFEMRLEVANEKYLLEDEPLLADSLTTLVDILRSPALEGDTLRTDYIEQEKEALARNIDSVFNDKTSYAARRCIQEMFEGEPYAKSEMGSKEEIAALDSAALSSFHRQLLSDMSCRVVISGAVSRPQAVSVCEDVFAVLGRLPEPVPLPFEHTLPRSSRNVSEEQDINQGKLVLGYRTNTAYSDPLFPALAMYSGVLGAFPHSKLFINVREKASLAYYCYSSLLPIKGAMLIQAGIAFDKLNQTTEIILEQMNALRTGDITSDEMEKTRMALIDSLRADEDYPARQGRTHVERLVAGARFSNADLIERINRVSREDIVTIAERVWLDTSYFLQGKGGQSNGS